MNRRFELTDSHLALLRRMWVRWDDCENGAPQIDPKRPYGNSYVPGDVAEILGWTLDDNGELTDLQEDVARALHHETETALQIVLHTGSFEPGFYECNDYGWNWQKHV